MFLSAAIPGPQPGSLPLAHGSTGAGANVGSEPQAGRGALQKVALWSFTALASARACTKEKRNRVRKVLHRGADPKQPSSSCKNLVETCPTPSP